MSLSKLACVAAMLLCGAVFLAFPGKGFGQTNYYSANGSEYAVVGSMAGDQVFPDVAVTTSGGFEVWQDNITDGSGWGVSARRLDSTFSGSLSTFRVNTQGTNDQENPRVAMLKNGGAVFVWQGGERGSQHIFARFLTPTNTWLTTTDLLVSTYTNTFQVNPAVTVLNNSNVVVVWSSYNQSGSGSQLDVYGKILSPTGQTVSNVFLINQYNNFNQRTPVVTALKNGGFVVAWVSEQQRSSASASPSQYYPAGAIPTPSVDIYARLYSGAGTPLGSEFPVNTNLFPCANPSLAAASNDTFMIAWSQHDMVSAINGWDVFARSFSSAGVGGTVLRVNTYSVGDQYAPKISAINLDYLIVFTSLGQDGSREGVFGQYVHSDGTLVGKEITVNTTTVGQQMQPAVASDGTVQFEVVWASFTGLPNDFDLFAQRFADVSAILQPMSAPFVYAPFNLSNNVYLPQLQVSWPMLSGLSVSNFEVYVDGSVTPMALVTSNQWVMGVSNGLKAGTNHSFQVDYVTTDNRRSPLSASATGSTWSGLNYYGIPYEWMQAYYLSGISTWPTNVNALLSPHGMSLYNVFLSGGNPLDPNTWLKVSVARTSEGTFVGWNTQPGMVYQVQYTTNLTTWNNLGTARFAAGNSDSMYVGGAQAVYYRVVLLR